MLLDMAADGMGDRVAIGPAGSGGGVSYASLSALASAGAAWVASSGASTVAYADANGPAAAVALFAAARAGASYCPLNYRLPPASLTALAERLDGAVAVSGS